MTQQDSASPPKLARIATGVPGLDEITGGGLVKSGVYILQGSPGAGKTILANQICFHHAAAGGRVVYVTMLAESHARLFQHLNSMAFFDQGLVPENVFFISGFNALQSGGLRGVVTLLRSEMRAHKAGILVLDGLVMAATAAASDQELKVFISDLQAHATLTGCTTLLLTSDDAERPVSAEQTMVDGILLLREQTYGPRRERNLEVRKFRGSATLRGNHAFRISDDGIVAYPRFEAAHADSPRSGIKPRSVSTGVAGLDAMSEIRGVREGSVTALSGYAGSGKTVLALHFAAQASASSPALFFGFYESPEFLLDIGATFGLDLAARQAEGALTFLWRPYGENLLDELASHLLETVRRTGARRVVLDGAGGFMAASTYAERGGSFFASLANELRRMSVTTFLTVETEDPASFATPISVPSMSALADNVIRLQFRQDEQTRRFLSIGKMRGCRYDQRVREVLMTENGLHIEQDGDDVERKG
ncbi:RAD55 family ATPase [Caldimonas tepidiphila]|uniref:RAD55 family ATPase n=1 Tax=Caldimonas tepidiphila TaxID=2315841 RepID=UPI0014738BCD|nr:ATPase domain-containing protein [Caldimonas tepidiphila]